MQIEFKELTIKNFMSFKDASLELQSKGLHFVYGEVDGQIADSNGAGKSAWVEALSWCLFGKTLREMRADEVVNAEVGKNCEVSVIFEKDGQGYVVKRFRKTDSGSGVEFAFWGAGRRPEDDLTGESNDATNEKIEAVLGFSFELFKNTICHGQGLPYRFTQATDAEKKEIFDEILNLGWMQGAKKRTSELITRYNEVLAAEELEQVSLRERVSASDEVIQSLFSRKDELLAQKPPAEDKAKAEELEARKRELTKKVEGRSGRINELARLIKETEGKSDSVTKKLIELQKRKIVSEEKVKYLSEEVDRNSKELKETKDLVGKSCPVCARPVREKDIEEVRSHLKKARVKKIRILSGAKDKFNGLVAEYKELALVESVLHEKLDELNGEKTVLDFDNENNSGEIRSLDSEIAHIKGKTEAWKNSRVEQLDGLEAQIDQAKKRKRAAKTGLDESIEMSTYTQRLVDAIGFWVDGFGNRGIRSLVLDSVIPFLNKKAQEYSEVLTDGKFQISFSAQSETQRGEVREKFVVVVKDRGTGVLYTGFSGGEKRRVDVVVLLSLHDLIAFQSGIDSNIQIFDEVVENLDETGTSRLLQLLTERARNRGIYIISHATDFDGYFNSRIKVVKDGEGFSRIMQN